MPYRWRSEQPRGAARREDKIDCKERQLRQASSSLAEQRAALLREKDEVQRCHRALDRREAAFKASKERHVQLLGKHGLQIMIGKMGVVLRHVEVNKEHMRRGVRGER